MKSEWNRNELQKAAQGKLVFGKEERRQIQDNIRRRTVEASKLSSELNAGAAM